MELSFCEKIKYYFNYLYEKYCSDLFPYKQIIIKNKNASNYMNALIILKYISYGYINKFIIDKLNDNKNERVVICYFGEKEINTVIIAKSYNEINNKIKNIINNDYSNIINTKFPNFIENIYLCFKNNENNIDITNIVNNCVKTDCDILFHDIILMCNIDVNVVKNIKIKYVINFVVNEKIYDINYYIYEKINIINDIL